MSSLQVYPQFFLPGTKDPKFKAKAKFCFSIQ